MRWGGGQGMVGGGRRAGSEGHRKRLALMVAGNVNEWPVVVTTCSRGGATREW